ncbi:MAG: type 4a pilus biogenesis protein PilO [Microgenomates group bacterium]
MENLQIFDYHRYRRYFRSIKHFYLQKRVRVYTEVVFTLFTITFFLFFAIRPTLITISSLIKEIKEKREVVQALENKINALTVASSNYQKIEGDLYLVDQALPQGATFGDLVTQIEVLAFKKGVVIENFQASHLTIKEKNILDPEKEIEFNLTVVGEYQNLKEFLNSFSNLRRLIILENISFKEQKKETSNLILTLRCKAFSLAKK